MDSKTRIQALENYLFDSFSYLHAAVCCPVFRKCETSITFGDEKCVNMRKNFIKELK